MSPAVITLCVLAVAAFFFVTELIPLAVTAIGASIAFRSTYSTTSVFWSF